MLVAWLAMAPAAAQQTWTMDDCIDYAVEHAVGVRQKKLEVLNAQADVGIALADFLPSVSASVSGQYSWGRNVDPETNTYSTVTTLGNNYSIYASLRVFDGGQTLNAFRRARLLRRQSLTMLEQEKDEQAIDVMQKFVDAAYTQRCIELAKEKLDDSQQLLAKTLRMEQLGMKSRPDVALAEAQVAEDDYNLTHQQNLHLTAMATLKSAMNFPCDDSLHIATIPLPPSPLLPPPSSLLLPPSSLHEIPSTRIAQMNLKKAILDLAIAKGRLLPTLSLAAGLSTSYFRNLTGRGSAIPFHQQIADNRGEYVAATLSIPLLQFAQFKNLRKAKHNIQLAQLQADETLRQLHDNTLQAALDCQAYQKEISKMQSKAQSDSVAHHLAQRKYEQGMTDLLQLHTTAQTLLQSRIQLLQLQMMLIIKRRLLAYYTQSPNN